MKKYTKEEVVKLFKEHYERQDYCFHNLKPFLEEFELIKEEFEVGKWYKAEYDNNILINFQGKDSDSYGINCESEWTTYFGGGQLWYEDPKPATDKEVKEALIKEWEKENVKFNTYRFVNGLLQGSQNVIQPRSSLTDWKTLFCNGKWAEILEEKKEEDFIVKVSKGVITIDGEDYTPEEIISKFKK